jgi:superfamily II DNA or RNA helicase
MPTPALPSPGQIVTVRKRRHVVQRIERGAIPEDHRQSLLDCAAHHLVTLQSIDDDGLGEELSVLWEIEPGARIHERSTLPEPTPAAVGAYDSPRRLDAFLDAVRWGAVASADVKVLHAPFRSGITIEDYQLDPVARALQMPRVSLLIADDVGLGKTIEAGLVVQELLLRHRARTVLVVCPAGLQVQWREQMRDKFGLEFRIVDSDLMRELRRRRGPHVNPWSHFPRLITSIDFLKRDRPMRLMRDLLPDAPQLPRRFDLLIVDEAHNVAPAVRQHYAVPTRRTLAIRDLAAHFEHKLFLSATPHNGYSESFAALLNLLDDRRFQVGMPEVDRKMLDAVMVRRLKEELATDAVGRRRFALRVLAPIEVDYDDDERRIHRALGEYTALRLTGTHAEAEQFAAEFVLKLLKKRLFSSPEAFRLTLERHLQTLREGRTRERHTARPSLKALAEETLRAEEDASDDEARELVALETVHTTTTFLRPPTPGESALLWTMLDWAERASGRPDAKARELFAWLERTLRPGGAWSDERVIIFTEYRATQNWLEGLLTVAGFAADGRLLTLYGGMDRDARERVKAAFQAAPSVSPVRILLATDAASEGIDLQNHCSRMIHYEIPWNPSRLEQRNGRVDRHGQRAEEVQILHFVGRGYDRSDLRSRPPGDLEGDLEFLMRAARKVEQIRTDLGSFGEVFARQVEEAMLGKRRALDLSGRDERAAASRRVLAFERKLREELGRLQKKLDDSREELHLGPERLRQAVEVAFALAGHPPLVPVQVGDFTAYQLPHLAGSWAPCCDGLEHPHTHVRRPVVFDADLAASRDDVVLVHLGHRLVQMCLRLLRAEVWAPDDARKLRRWTVITMPSHAANVPYVVAHARLVVLGSDHSTLHEEVVLAGGELRGGSFRRIDSQDKLETALAAARPDAPVDPGVVDALAAHWAEHRPALERALEARRDARVESLLRRLAERCDKDIAETSDLLTELGRHIADFLAEEREPPPQLRLFADDESRQYRADTRALIARAEAIPAEIEREAAAIRRRYDGPRPHLFPVAVTYLIPERLAKR